MFSKNISEFSLNLNKMDDTVSSTSIPSAAEENSLDYTGYFLNFWTPFSPIKIVHTGNLVL